MEAIIIPHLSFRERFKDLDALGLRASRYFLPLSPTGGSRIVQEAGGMTARPRHGHVQRQASRQFLHVKRKRARDRVGGGGGGGEEAGDVGDVGGRVWF